MVGTVISDKDNVVSEFSSGTGCGLTQSCQEYARIVHSVEQNPSV